MHKPTDTVQLIVRCQNRDRRRLKKFAADEGMTLSDYVRRELGLRTPKQKSKKRK